MGGRTGEIGQCVSVCMSMCVCVFLWRQGLTLLLGSRDLLSQPPQSQELQVMSQCSVLTAEGWTLFPMMCFCKKQVIPLFSVWSVFRVHQSYGQAGGTMAFSLVAGGWHYLKTQRTGKIQKACYTLKPRSEKGDRLKSRNYSLCKALGSKPRRWGFGELWEKGTGMSYEGGL